MERERVRRGRPLRPKDVARVQSYQAALAAFNARPDEDDALRFENLCAAFAATERDGVVDGSAVRGNLDDAIVSGHRDDAVRGNRDDGTVRDGTVRGKCDHGGGGTVLDGGGEGVLEECLKIV